MSIFDVLTLVGGLSLFLFGMNIMGSALERRAGSGLQSLLGKLTTGRLMGLFTGMGVTSVIQSSSATTVMVVGFVNSGVMTLRQAINVIMGANVGTTVTAWILSLSGIESDNVFVQLLKPTAFTPLLALMGIIFYMFCKQDKKKDTGMILLGFSVLMFGMDTMTDSVSGLADVPEFRSLFLLFTNPILGILVGALLTAVIQSSSASVGILQALAITGQVSYGAVVPIIMGQNIGTCVTALLSSVGTTRNAKRAALVHLCFNVIGSCVWITVFWIIQVLIDIPLLRQPASLYGIAVIHSAFNILCTLLLLPLSSLLEKLAFKLVPETKKPETVVKLDDRLLSTPAVALERCHSLAFEMANCSVNSLKDSIRCLTDYTPDLAKSVRDTEDRTDAYEDMLSTYLIKLSSYQVSDRDSAECAKLLKIIGDLERISDHAVNLVGSAEEIKNKGISLSGPAKEELMNLSNAVCEILDLSLVSFLHNDLASALKVEPLEQVIDRLKEKVRSGHILRLQQGDCSIETGFVWSDILTDLERSSDHCSNIAGCMIDAEEQNLNIHESLRVMKTESESFMQQYAVFAEKYL